ncbi:GNAT family N-acetyltransferase [Streptomyces sp. NBC_01367]|uniref:GNAT family N-acetyltransferase n=1 Tax=Streptomyces sp. NBC_01367 TaxID=2903841 RepID=UPI00324B0993
MTTDFTVRPARPADARRLAELRWAFKQEDPEGQPPAPERPLEEAELWIRERLGNGRWLAWVAETGDDVCGHVFLCPVERVPEPYGHDTPIGYVTNFFVTPPHRNKGIGSALLEALELHARRAEFDTLIVWPSDRSSPLYRRSGYQPPEELVELPLDR